MLSMEELERALAEAVDADGNDVRLAEATARMTAEERRASDESLRRSLAEARESFRPRP